MHHVVIKSVGIRHGEEEERFAIFVLQNPVPAGKSVVLGGPDGGPDNRGYTRDELRRRLADVYGVDPNGVMPS